MPLQDLTPQLRTRLNRMEKATGFFILTALFLLVFGFCYYVYKVAEGRGWFADKAKYHTFAKSAAGLHVGDHVKFLGFDVGEITQIKEMSPEFMYENPNQNIFIEFVILNREKVNQHSGYIWTEGSSVRFNDVGGGFLGKRELEFTMGTGGYGSYVEYPVENMSLAEVRSYGSLEKLILGEEISEGSNRLYKANTPIKPLLDKLVEIRHDPVYVIEKDKPSKHLLSVWDRPLSRYVPYARSNSFLLPAEETPGLTDRLGDMTARIQSALPGILALTNKITATLDQAQQATSNLNTVLLEVRKSATNLTEITGNLKNPQGSLGTWLLPADTRASLDSTLATAKDTMATAQGTLNRLDTNLHTLNLTLEHTAGITSNLNQQVQSNTNILTNISKIIVHSDEFIQGLKRFWLFRSTFSTNKVLNKPIEKPLALPAQKPRN